MGTPLVSIVMPLYNSQLFVADAVESLLQQTYKNFELLICDDGSQDQSLDIVKRYMHDQRVQVLKNRNNKGIVFTRNKLLDACQGDFIAILDSDDVALPDRIATQVAYLQDHPDYGFIGSWVKTIETNGMSHTWRFEHDAQRIKIRQLFHNCFAQSSVMLRRDVVKTHRYKQHYTYSQDFDLWSRLLKKVPGTNIPQVLVLYRRQLQSVSHRHVQEQEKFAMDVIQASMLDLHLELSPEELLLHRAIGKNAIEQDMESLQQAGDYLEMLRKEPAMKVIANTDVMEQVLAELLWQLTCWVARTCGLQAWWYWNNHPLRKWMKMRNKQQLQMMATSGYYMLRKLWSR